MALKLALLFVAVFLLFQFATWSEANPRAARDTQTPTQTQTQDASKAIDEAFHSLTAGVNDLLAKIKGNELFQNVSSALENFGQSVQDKGKELVQKIQKAAE